MWKMLRIFMSLFSFLCCGLPFKKWGMIMKNVKMLHDWSPDVCINGIQLAHWCIESIYKLTITLMYVVYFVFTGLSWIQCLIFYIYWESELFCLFWFLINYFSLIFIVFCYRVKKKIPQQIELLSLLRVIK